MTIRNIMIFPNEILIKKSTNIVNIDKNIIKIILDMIETMYYNNGIGLAAPQIGINKRLIVIDLSEKYKQSFPLINLEIIFIEGKIYSKEGCLSFPNFFLDVKRNKIVKIKFLNIDNEKIIIKIDNLLSICSQHENDHLNGITLYDKMSKLKKHLLF